MGSYESELELYRLASDEADQLWDQITSTSDDLVRAKDTIEWFAGKDLYDRWVIYAG